MNCCKTILLFLGLLAASSARATGLESIPPDLPLPASRPCPAEWLRGANILQPYGNSQYAALANIGDRPARLKSELGFNTIIVLPPDCHNAISEAKYHMTDSQFRAGVGAYRAAGYHLILYTSVMGCGLAPEFQSGQLAREHPDWLQRDAKGNPIMVYGVPWLCPSGPAREYTLEHTLRIAREYKPDGLMLDNNEFFEAGAGWTCHCVHCTEAFRNYVGRRLGAAQTQRLFGVPPDKLEIPTQEGPLFSLWLRWRNRDWAEVNELFRARLRQMDPNIFLCANTQYLFNDGMLGTDLQYEREDILISESCNLTSRKMSEKMVLGGAMAEGRPLWNYIGTFVNNDDYTGLKPAPVVAPLIAATVAHNARPWIVDGFDLGQTNAESRREMAALLGWHAAHPELSANQPWTPVGVVFSLDSRNLLHRPLIPPHLGALLKTGVPVAGLRDDEITFKKLKPFHVITLETAACLGEAQARALARWVRSGGTLIAARDAGCYDELGRQRDASVLWTALGFATAPERETSVERGKVIAPAPKGFSGESVKYTEAYSFRVPNDSEIEVVPYEGKKTLVLHLVSHGPSAKTTTLTLPGSFQTAQMAAQWLKPGADKAQEIPMTPGPKGFALTIVNAPVYSVVKIALR